MNPKLIAPDRVVTAQEVDSNRILELQAALRLLQAEKHRGFLELAKQEEVRKCWKAVKDLGDQVNFWTTKWAQAINERNSWRMGAKLILGTELLMLLILCLWVYR